MRTKILKLYKDLLRYGERLEYTDNEFFKRRVKKGFVANKKIVDEKDIEFQFEVQRIEAAERPKSDLAKRLLNLQKSYEMFRILEKCTFLKSPGLHLRCDNNAQCLSSRLMSLKNHLDYSKVPKVDEADVDIQFVRGSGPGGQATNKTNNAVVIKHKATGIVVKCHKTRSMWDNKKIAMDNLVTKLDNLINGQESIEGQIKVYQHKKSADKDRKKNKLDKLKAAFKEREGLT